jgi:hypothetical protein
MSLESFKIRTTLVTAVQSNARARLLLLYEPLSWIPVTTTVKIPLLQRRPVQLQKTCNSRNHSSSQRYHDTDGQQQERDYDNESGNPGTGHFIVYKVE